MAKITGEQLRDLLRQQIQAASDDTVRSGGQIIAEKVDGLARLSRLVDLYQAAHPPHARKRWPVAVAMGGTLLAVSLLLFVRVAETEIELDLMLSEVGFTLPAQQVLAANIGPAGLRPMAWRNAWGRITMNHQIISTRQRLFRACASDRSL